ncbi:hypothetical protein [Zhihengliuella sp.]|uniref:hypothetical protein n=1 Tax=Zhihengliuella sp. TaxID=1954483 RepID=UPI002810F812|nr:hypothetical protein [Zhihengliuella sp.]
MMTDTTSSTPGPRPADLSARYGSTTPPAAAGAPLDLRHGRISETDISFYAAGGLDPDFALDRPQRESLWSRLKTRLAG